MARIFLCHSSEDKPQVRDVYQRLTALGFEPWLDEFDILPGQDWDYALGQALETSDFVMVFLSKRSVEKIGYVQREFRHALYRSEEMPEGYIHTIPVKLDDCTVPRRFSRHQWVNLQEVGAFDRIVRALYLGLQQRGEPLDVAGMYREAERRVDVALFNSSRELNLSRLRLSSVPENLGLLSQLQKLSLANNSLNIVPEWFAKLNQLKELHLENNRLSSLPDSIGQLGQLEKLHLENNRLRDLPRSLGQLSQLRELYIHGNPELGIPLEILGPTPTEFESNRSDPTPADILAYYFRTQYGHRSLNEAKLILVGYGNVGKTSLVNRLVYHDFNPGEAKTEGINITKWPLQLPSGDYVQLNIWDFGGQEIMHATHQFFLTQRSLYLLVLNGRQGQEDRDAEYWLQLIESFGDESLVIIVLNKIKEHHFDLNRRNLERKFPSIRAFVQTDCEDETGIDDLKQMIMRETDRLEHLRDAFPASWFSIKDELSRMRKNYLSYNEYREVCKQHGETDHSAQDGLAFYLNNLGIVLNYHDDPRLQDTHVLNPHWVTEGIYSLLNSKHLAMQKGVFAYPQLSEILDPTQYPPQMHGFLCNLMRKFELCFSFPEEPDRYLVPELLDKQEPEKVGLFDPGESLNFEYHYPILPEGLLPRFIVRTHVLSIDQPRWKTGVILQFEGNLALVKADVQNRKVAIHVTGTLTGRRRLLAVIRSDFEHIHRSFSFEPQEMVPVPIYPGVVLPYKKLQVFENSGRDKIEEVLGNKIIELDVRQLLNGIDLEGVRRTAQTNGKLNDALHLFYSYSHKDEQFRDELEIHLKLLQRQGLITVWHDRRIMAGDEWDRQIDQNLERADIILLLVSADFIASDYCYEIEMQRALERHASGNVRVVPIIVRDVNWRSAPFANLQALPTDGRAVMNWKDDRDSAWRSVAEGIEHVINELRAQ